MTETIIMGIFFAGTIAVASPYLTSLAIPKIIQYIKSLKNKHAKRNFESIFSRLKSKGLIKISNRNGQIYISLTKKGKEKAGKYQINDLEIKKPQSWDGKWRILIFDIKEEHRIKRDALRGKIKELGLFKLQDSVWIHPYDLKKEMGLLRSFFGITKREMQIITNCKLENDNELKIFFKL